MRNILVFVASAYLTACTCGVTRQACTSKADCASGQICSTGFCVAGTSSDGGTGGNTGTGGGFVTGGGSQGTGGGSQGTGGGVANMTACVGLQCQQTDCATTHTGCTVQPCGGATTVSGTVFEPAGQLPLYNVTVYVPNSAVQPFGIRGVCEACGATVTGSPLTIALTDDKGQFTLNNVPVGANIPLVIQIGRWRRQVTIPNVAACGNTPVAPTTTRMPRNKNEGDIPLMAIASGGSDPFECLLLKMGIDAAEFTVPTGTGRVHYYVENGLDMPGAPAGSSLTSTAAALNPYDVTFLPCEGNENRKSSTQLTNVENYVNSGGRLFVTHYGYVWTALAPAPFSNTAQWHPDPNIINPPPDPVNVTINTSFAKGAAFSTWLQNNGAASGGTISLSQSRNDVGVVNPGSTAWMKGDGNGGAGYNWTPHMTFTMPFNPPNEPDGGPGPTCGRVVFSDFHVTTSATNGGTTFPSACRGGAYTAQEKALVFMVFDLSSCVQDDSKPPMVCVGVGSACNSGADCCSGLVCEDGNLNTCTSGGPGCACQVPIQ